MSKWFTFPSLARPTWRYRLFVKDSDNPAYNWRTMRSGIDSHLSQFDTMGDGEVQHSPDCLVQNDDVFDVIMSLGASIHRIKLDLNDSEQCESKVLRWFWRSQSAVGPKEIEFARSLKYSDTKRVFYTFTDNGPRKSNSDAKKHDRRWIELPSMPEGTSEVSRVLTIIGHDETKCRPHGIINHIATVIAIAKAIDDQSWQHLVLKELKTGSVFEQMDRMLVFEMINTFERISKFKESVNDLQWARQSSINQLQRHNEKRAEAQPA